VRRDELLHREDFVARLSAFDPIHGSPSLSAPGAFKITTRVEEAKAA
jgi:hypothetical protein